MAHVVQASRRAACVLAALDACVLPLRRGRNELEDDEDAGRPEEASAGVSGELQRRGHRRAAVARASSGC